MESAILPPFHLSAPGPRAVKVPARNTELGLEETEAGAMDGAPQRIPVPEHCGIDRDTFLQLIYPLRRPMVIKGLDLGPCTTKWTVDYICKAGGSKEVKIHVSPVAQMDFLNKNFIYRSLPFDAFVQRAVEEKHEEYFICEEEKYYLRSLGEDARKDVADIRKQFPELAEDIKIPEFFEKEQLFSSVFRISSPRLQLWTHYDVMDNLLIQVTGRKRVVLYSPRDAAYLYLMGDKSEVLDVDNPDLNKYPLFPKARRYECCLEAGDVLFIPALWFHNTIAEEFGVAVNVFWRHLSSECYDKTDTYGNKDPVAASRAVQILDRALKTLDELPEEYKDFYARRMVLRIQAKAYSVNYE
ncbi:tRNA wybutosine-synthesizing protein 5 isoform X1 [Microcaecilia unicolor]|uniref:tRNA wybutosine-synthesizing protein 5 n=1 Tax=Microcaecilia unicolor TaxID=1415580 RepID=A0A6P7YEI5_9AMPH|nr:tRNA wybutosine-synthesizing protein 5 isoform X1 [Microcaecilia unicolor]